MGNEHAKAKGKKDIATAFGLAAKIFLGEDEPSQQLAQRIAEHGEDTSSAVKRGIAKAVKALDKFSGHRETGSIDVEGEAVDEPEPDRACVACKVAVASGRKACPEHL